MKHSLQRIAVTGGCGQIAYHLLFRIANGDLLGKDQPIALQILEVESCLGQLEGVVMELQDGCFPLLQEISIGSDPYKMFQGAHFVFLIGSKPRGPGMERKDLLKENAPIFVEQGKALNAVADKEVQILVVGNPCNTNCLVALHHAPRLSPSQFHALTRLDQNRAVYQLAHKAQVDAEAISQLAIWGNHSATLVPDFEHARIDGKPFPENFSNLRWLQEEFFQTVQQRGSVVIAVRGKSSAASASQAILDATHALWFPFKDRWFSSAVYTKDNPYGIADGLIFSFPCIGQGSGRYEIVKDLFWSDFLREKILLSEEELLRERDCVSHLL